MRADFCSLLIVISSVLRCSSGSRGVYTKCQEHIAGGTAKHGIARVGEQHSIWDGRAAGAVGAARGFEMVPGLKSARRAEVPDDLAFAGFVGAQVSISGP